FGLGQPLAAQTPPASEGVLDRLETFNPGRAHVVLSDAVRRPGSAGGLKKYALFDHPLVGDKPAPVEYEIFPPPPRPVVAQNKHLRIEVIDANSRLAYARILVRQNGDWLPVGVW